MLLERVTKIELNVDEQRRITLDYLTKRRAKNSNALNFGGYTAKEYARTLKNENSALDAVIKILENEI